jgi:hypothetical protein
MTGSAPGNPKQTGHVDELGGNPKSARHPQNNFVRVSSWTWTSKPMTTRKLMRSGLAIRGMRDIIEGHSHPAAQVQSSNPSIPGIVKRIN